MVGPKYEKPSVETPPAYKELTPADFKNTDGWKVAQPKDDALRGPWWTIFNDPQLNALEQKVNLSNQTLASATASFFAARALVKEAKAQLYPTVTVGASVTESKAPGTGTDTNFLLPFDATWVPDLWGSVRNAIRSAAYGAQASAADLENTRLTIQAEVAEDYLQLRGQDALKALFDATVTAYQQSLDFTKTLYSTGIESAQDVTQAESQLESAQAQDVALGIQRAQYEHAIAMLTGQPASTFSIGFAPLTSTPPAIPFGVPSELLERRPDIASAERLVAQANAQIGIAKAAYYPTVTLSASAGFESSSLAHWLTWPSRFFSIGPSASETLFDAGLRQATVEQFTEQYVETVANYRQAVLTAFQQVEDNLASLRILSIELQHQDAAVASAQTNLDMEMNRYKLGLDPYLDVIIAQTTLLTDQQTDVNLRIQQMTASNALIEALGGGWNVSDLPTPSQVGA
jgi:NodT family efflux transporter outer membrane factor (OMF) lipoprotein